MDVKVKGTAMIGSSNDNFHAAVQGDLAVTGNNSGKVDVDGSASASIGFTFAGTSHDMPVGGFKFNNNGFTIDFFGYDAQVNW